MSQLSERALSRRSLLKRGAAVGVGTVWIVPVVQGFSMTAAHAATPSGAPTNPVPNPPTVKPVPPHRIPTGAPTSNGIDPLTIHSDPAHPATHPATSAGHGIDAKSISRVTASSSTRGLANTGPAVPVGDALKYGIGAVAVGTAALAAGHRRKPATPSATVVEQRRPRPGPNRPTHAG